MTAAHEIGAALGVAEDLHGTAHLIRRDRPVRELILRIGDTLRVPLPERSTLLAAAGFAPSFPGSPAGIAGNGTG